MPTATFSNLPDKKKERLLSAARKEFARVSFEKASINKIVQDAGISRGSFYMYFKDKTDLLQYILEDYFTAMVRYLKNSLENNNGNPLLMMEDLFKYSTNPSIHGENSNFMRCILSQWKIIMEVFGFSMPHEDGKFKFSDVFSLINKELLNIRTEKDIKDILEILTVVTRKAIVDALRKPECTVTIQKSFYNKLEILKWGMLKPSL